MTRTLVLLRHGRTAWNAEGRAQGHIDVPLDATGRAQAAAVAPVIAALAPSFIWSSDLARAAETAEVVAASCGLPVVRDARLREYDMGEQTGLTMSQFAVKFPAANAERAAGTWSGSAGAVLGAESKPDLLARMVPALREALMDLKPGEAGVLVGHGAALRATITALVGWDAATSATLCGLANCGWAVLDDSGPEGGLRLAAYNRTAPDFASARSVG